MKKYKDKEGFYRGKLSPAIAELNGLSEFAENESAYLTADNEVIASDVEIKGALLFEDMPTALHRNVGGKWVEMKARPQASEIEVLTERVDAIEAQLNNNNTKGK